MDNKYPENLLRFIGATVYSQSLLLASKELFGRSYYSLSPEEKNAVNLTLNNQIQANTLNLTPQLLETWLNQANAGTVGFQAPQPASPTKT